MSRNEVCSPIGDSRGLSNFRIKAFFRTIFHYCISLVISCFIYVIKSKCLLTLYNQEVIYIVQDI